MKYAIRRFAPDGESITDHYAESVERAWYLCEDAGSRWFFYPICVAIRKDSDKKTGRIVDAPSELRRYIGKTCGTLAKDLATASEMNPQADVYEIMLLA